MKKCLLHVIHKLHKIPPLYKNSFNWCFICYNGPLWLSWISVYTISWYWHSWWMNPWLGQTSLLLFTVVTAFSRLYCLGDHISIIILHHHSPVPHQEGHHHCSRPAGTNKAVDQDLPTILCNSICINIAIYQSLLFPVTSRAELIQAVASWNTLAMFSPGTSLSYCLWLINTLDYILYQPSV